MESPDVVDTSDVEEREVFAVSEDVDHWTSSASTPRLKSVRANVSVSPQSATTENGHQRHLGILLTLARHNRSGDHEVENPSPRKRIKVR